MSVTVRYTGTSQGRVISARDIKDAFDIDHEGIMVDVAQTRDVGVPADLAAALVDMDPNEWSIVVSTPPAEAPSAPSAPSGNKEKKDGDE